MDEIINTTTTTTGSTTVAVEQITYATTSPEYNLQYNAAALLWLVFLIVATCSFVTIFYYAYKMFKKK